jgi:hypothetical protein
VDWPSRWAALSVRWKSTRRLHFLDATKPQTLPASLSLFYTQRRERRRRCQATNHGGAAGLFAGASVCVHPYARLRRTPQAASRAWPRTPASSPASQVRRPQHLPLRRRWTPPPPDLDVPLAATCTVARTSSSHPKVRTLSYPPVLTLLNLNPPLLIRFSKSILLFLSRTSSSSSRWTPRRASSMFPCQRPPTSRREAVTHDFTRSTYGPFSPPYSLHLNTLLHDLNPLLIVPARGLA